MSQDNYTINGRKNKHLTKREWNGIKILLKEILEPYKITKKLDTLIVIYILIWYDMVKHYKTLLKLNFYLVMLCFVCLYHVLNIKLRRIFENEKIS